MNATEAREAKVKTIVFSARLEPATLAALTHLAQATGKTRGAVVRSLILAALDQGDTQPATAR